MDLGTGFGIWSWSVWHGSEFLVGFQSNLICVPDWFASLPNCDYKMGRVMLMPFWWKFWSWVVVKRVNIKLLVMGVRYIAVSVASTVLTAKLCLSSILDWVALDNLKSDGLIAENYIHSENASRVIKLLSGSYATIGVLTNFVLNVFVLLVLCLKVSLLSFWGTFKQLCLCVGQWTICIVDCMLS